MSDHQLVAAPNVTRTPTPLRDLIRQFEARASYALDDAQHPEDQGTYPRHCREHMARAYEHCAESLEHALRANGLDDGTVRLADKADLEAAADAVADAAGALVLLNREADNKPYLALAARLRAAAGEK